MKTKNFLFITFLLFFSYFAATPKLVSASLFDDFISGMNNTLQGGVSSVKNLITPAEDRNKLNKILALDSTIALAASGDINKNGQIDSGDTITFTYEIKNSTDKKYVYATLKSNVKRESINFIRNVTGVTGLKDDGKTIDFPNLQIGPNEVKIISFDANVNYFTEQDPIISTEPELITEDKKSLLKSGTKYIQGKRVRTEDIPGMVKVLKKDK